jgi:hypothetical protein
MILLPEKLMQPRLADSRVGWFTMSQFDYGSSELNQIKPISVGGDWNPKILKLMLVEN